MHFSLLALGLSALTLISANPLPAAEATKCTSSSGKAIKATGGSWQLFCKKQITDGSAFAAYDNIANYRSCIKTCYDAYESGEGSSLVAIYFNPADGGNCSCWEEVDEEAEGAAGDYVATPNFET